MHAICLALTLLPFQASAAPQADSATDPFIERAIIALQAGQGLMAGPLPSGARARLGRQIVALEAVTGQRTQARTGSAAVQNSAARFALQAGDGTKALALARRAADLARGNGDQSAFRRTLVTLSAARAAGKDFVGACSDAQRVLMDEPHDATAVELRLFSCGRPDGAPPPQASDTFRWLAQQSPLVAHTPGQWLKEQRRRRTPGFAGVAAAMRALEAGDAKTALQRAGEALAADGGDPMAWAQRGIARGRLGDDRGAIADLSRAIDMGLAWNVPYRLRAEALIKAKRYPEAIGDATIAAALDPKDAAAYAARAAAKRGAGMPAADVEADLRRSRGSGIP